MIKTKISADIIADSKNEFGNRLTTFILKFPRIILAEFNTHRMISKNSASSRAIPFKKMMDMVLQDPFIPINWMKDHSGMQGNEFFNEKESEKLYRIWIQSSMEAVTRAQELNQMGLSKQICNRILEPYMWHTVICTGSEWENFFALRAHGAAEIHMQELANCMLEVYNDSTPTELKAYQWHIPFGNTIDENRIVLDGLAVRDHEHELGDMTERVMQIATARCARVSYLNFEGKDDYTADVKLHDNLLNAGHMSPFEHCARAMNAMERNAGGDISEQTGWSGNFCGFTQYRKLLENENKSDNRVIKK